MAIEIFNPITGEIHHSCQTGHTCSASARPDLPRTFYYLARVSQPGGSGVQATSNQVNVTWRPAPPPVDWQVGITASNYSPELGELVVITATANYDVSGTGMAIEIYNPITGEIHHSCDTGFTCTTSALTCIRAFALLPGSCVVSRWRWGAGNVERGNCDMACRANEPSSCLGC